MPIFSGEEQEGGYIRIRMLPEWLCVQIRILLLGLHTYTRPRASRVIERASCWPAQLNREDREDAEDTVSGGIKDRESDRAR